MAISLTESAATRVRTHLASRGSGLGLRLGVRKTGCSGFAYVVDMAEAAGSEDHLLEIDGIPLIVDNTSLPLVDGTVIDFARQGLNASFVFHNPNATGECGCGESFTVS